MKIYCTVFVLIICLLAGAAEPFAFPKGTKVLNRDNSGKTWQVNAIVAMPFEKTKKALHETVIKNKFKFKHEIILDEKEKKHTILSYIKGKDNLIIMVWAHNDKQTFFSYGVNR